MGKISNVIKYGVPIFSITWLLFFGDLILYCLTKNVIALDLLVTLSFLAYHMSIRPLIGQIVGFFRPTFAPKMRRFKVSPYEVYMYEKLNIRKWKDKLPAWNKNNFVLSLSDIKDIDKVTKVIRYNISAEITHTVNYLLSFLSALLSLIPGYDKFLWVFLVVSFVISSCADWPFILIQRYNRARLLQVYIKLEKKELKNELKERE